MPNTLILPGLSGKVSETVPGGGSFTGNVFDTSRCAQLLIQVISHSGDSTTISIQHNGTTLTTFPAAVGMNRISISQGTFGLITFASDGTTGGTTFLIVGYEVQRES